MIQLTVHFALTNKLTGKGLPMIDLKLAVEIIENYKALEAQIPALKSEHDLLTSTIANLKSSFSKEQKALDGLLAEKALLLAELQKHKEQFLSEAKALRSEAEQLKASAAALLNDAKVRNAEARLAEEGLAKKAREVDALKSLLAGKVSVLKDTIAKLF